MPNRQFPKIPITVRPTISVHKHSNGNTTRTPLAMLALTNTDESHEAQTVKEEEMRVREDERRRERQKERQGHTSTKERPQDNEFTTRSRSPDKEKQAVSSLNTSDLIAASLGECNHSYARKTRAGLLSARFGDTLATHEFWNTSARRMDLFASASSTTKPQFLIPL